MTTEPPPDDLRRIWQDQPHEGDPMKLDTIHAKAAALGRRARRQDIAIHVVFGLGIAGNAVASAFARNGMDRAGDVLSILAFLYLMSYYWRYREAAPGLLGATTTLDIYRRDVARRLAMGQHLGTRLALPFAAGIVLFAPGIVLSIVGGAMASPPPASKSVVAAVIFGLTVAGIEWSKRREARKLEAEITSLEI